MIDRRTQVMSWLEGLTFDDWHMYHSDSEVQEIAKVTLELLEEEGDMGKELTDAVELIHKKNARIIELKDLLKEQEAKTGYWIDSAGNDKCSICGAEYSDLYPDYGNTHFCPNCGAKMKGR